jgi:FixJ family two-component response regulator
MVMPEMSGPALARQLFALRPEMAVRYMSGYADYPAEEATAAGFLQKPFTPDSLAVAVCEAIDASSSVAQSAAR